MTDLDGEVTLRPDPSKRLPHTSSCKTSKLPHASAPNIQIHSYHSGNAGEDKCRTALPTGGWLV